MDETKNEELVMDKDLPTNRVEFNVLIKTPDSSLRTTGIYVRDDLLTQKDDAEIRAMLRPIFRQMQASVADVLIRRRNILKEKAAEVTNAQGN